MASASTSVTYSGCPADRFVNETTLTHPPNADPETRRIFAHISPNLVLADGNFPVSSVCRSGPTEVRADGLGIPELLQAILKLFPLDTYIKHPAAVMDLVDQDKEKGLKTPIWGKYLELLSDVGCEIPLQKVERFTFYARAREAFAVVATGETALYGNLILKKGVIPTDKKDK